MPITPRGVSMRNAAKPPKPHAIGGDGCAWGGAGQVTTRCRVAAPQWQASAAMRCSCSISAAGSPSETTMWRFSGTASSMRTLPPSASRRRMIRVRKPRHSASASFGWFR
ncbi:hypothetical protein D3C87_1155800 [compost metagenome]